ncbi:MAG: S8 family peptidase, partial [Planctomycetota bacterium]
MYPNTFALLATPLLAVAASAQSVEPTVVPYGCGLAPADSLTLKNGLPTLGSTFQVSSVVPGGPQGLLQGISILFANTSADPAYPCGTPLPGYGYGGQQGELLIPLDQLMTLSTGQPDGADSVVFDVAVPATPSFEGAHVYLQAAHINLLTGKITLSSGLDATLGTLPQPNLTVDSVAIDKAALDAGEALGVLVRGNVVDNGDIGTFILEISVGGQTQQVPVSVNQDGPFEVEATFVLNQQDAQFNPLFASATVDPGGQVAETDEGDNQASSVLPAFLVDVTYQPPSLGSEYDLVMEFDANGQLILAEEFDYGPNGGETDDIDFVDPEKGLQPEPQPGLVPEQPRIDPELAAADAAAQPGDFLEYLVAYKHGVAMPALPALVDTTDRYSQVNVPIHEQRLGLYEATKRLRISAADNLVAQIEQAGGEVLQFLPLGGALLVRAPKGLLDQLDANPQVSFVEQDDNVESFGTTADARALTEADLWFGLGKTGSGYVSIVDSGVRATHDMLTSPDRVWYMGDCVSGGSTCLSSSSSAYDPDVDDINHGTRIAGAITGNDNLGSDYHGFTKVWVDSWKVAATGGSGFKTSAIERAFDMSISTGAHIANCSFGSSAGPSGTLARAADSLFESNVAVIAANGNSGSSSGTVTSPACAHKVIGVGAYDVDDLGLQSYSSRGPTSDSRYKPDILAPDCYVTASSSSDTALASFCGTSGAAPVASSIAAILRDLLSWSSSAPGGSQAGRLYANLINLGNRDWDSPFNNSEGAGEISLPDGGFSLYTGYRTLTNGDNDYVSFYVGPDAKKISAAIWWPESDTATHRDLDLYLLKPSGSTSDSSLSYVSVFEHC